MSVGLASWRRSAIETSRRLGAKTGSKPDASCELGALERSHPGNYTVAGLGAELRS
jgi:hypothetical protein